MLPPPAYLPDLPCLGLPVSLPLPPPGNSLGTRKRGGQPGNTNAFRHGLYSRLNPQSGHTSTKPSLIKYFDLNAETSLLWSLSENRHKLAQIASITRDGMPHEELISWLRAITMIVGKNVKIIRTLHELGGRQEHMRSMVRNLHFLLNREFDRRGIPASSVFVPQELINLHGNFEWKPYHLSEGQWLHLREVFVSLQIELDSSRKYHRRKPLPSARFLFEGILWKLVNRIRWQDLPGKYPVRLCQDLYSALYRTGRMQIIYRQLHRHLNDFGESTLDVLVDRGCFVINGNRVRLSPSEDLTWEKYTGLFLLQQAFRSRRSIQNEENRERRRRGNFLRLPSLKIHGSIYRSQRAPRQLPPPHSTPLTTCMESVIPLVNENSPYIFLSPLANIFPQSVFHRGQISHPVGLQAPFLKPSGISSLSLSAWSFVMPSSHLSTHKYFCLKNYLIQSNILLWSPSFTERTSRAPPIIDLDSSSGNIKSRSYS